MDQTIPLRTIAPFRGDRDQHARIEWVGTWIGDEWEYADTLAEDVDGEDDLSDDREPGRLRIACHRCGRSLGLYEVERIWEWIILSSRTKERGHWRRGRLLLSENNPANEALHYEWECGCGARGYRRADRLADLPITLDRATFEWTLAL